MLSRLKYNFGSDITVVQDPQMQNLTFVVKLKPSHEEAFATMYYPEKRECIILTKCNSDSDSTFPAWKVSSRTCYFMP